MISRVAVLPHPPLLVPELVGGDDPDAAEVRAACLAAATSLTAAADHWFVIGAGERDARIEPPAAGTFRGFGVDVRVTLGSDTDTDTDADTASPDPALPLPALVAGWLRGRTAARRATVRVVPADLPSEDCAAAGARIAAELAGEAPVGLLVLGDGSHRHGERSVGRPDDRAVAFDGRVAEALAAADLDGLLGLDARLAADLGAAGRAPWQVLAGAVRADGRPWRCAGARLLVPFGVAYHVAEWEPVTA
ncbi:class III extradiol ring-cleavage dioxygenase family protein [Actinokineospora iranica]|uniref:Catalytic LigB subunit of aromatic ring-opening dioxygenase n=1 Tax=Actinokineospora iranica TaxID=1271860 RepID=A0A1G6LWE9_9PSEU|nr:hypothetical protein [Actinokineospora iranica]SDC47036.1 hypothetical protein SAMN05216174_102252 [Actinokineospora iranica]